MPVGKQCAESIVGASGMPVTGGRLWRRVTSTPATRVMPVNRAEANVRASIAAPTKTAAQAKRRELAVEREMEDFVHKQDGRDRETQHLPTETHHLPTEPGPEKV